MDTSSFSDLGVDSEEGSESSTPEWISMLLDTHLSTKQELVLKSSLRLGGSPLPRLDVAQGSEKWTNDCLDRLAHVQKLHSSKSKDTTSGMINVSDVDGLNSQDLIVALVGSRGCGKREFLANLLGTTSAGSDDMTEVKAIRCPHDIFGTESVILVDTPEFDASDQRSGTAALKQVLGWMRASLAEELRLTVLLYFHPLSAQLSGNHLINLRAFEDLCGEKNLGNIFLITTFPLESTEGSVGDSRDVEIELKNGGWNKLSKRGSAICRFDEVHCASSILQPLIHQRLAERGTNLLPHASDRAQSARLQHDLATYAHSGHHYEELMDVFYQKSYQNDEYKGARETLVKQTVAELIDLIIEEITADIRLETRGWLNGSIYHDICREDTQAFQEISSRAELKKCSLISKAWYPRAAKYIWRTITVDGHHPRSVTGLIGLLAERPDIAALVKHVDLCASWNALPDANDWIDDLARTLSSVTTLSLIYPPNQDDKEITYYRQDDSVLHHPFFRAVTSPQTLNNLTSLNYEGQIFPVKLLEYTPNLRDLSLQGPEEGGQDINSLYRHPMTRAAPYLKAFDKATSSTLSFRLQRAHFYKVARSVLDEFVEYHPQVFSQLKELYLADFLHNYSVERLAALQDLPSLALLMLTKDTLETLAIGVEMPRFTLEEFFSRDGPIEFPRLKNLTIGIVAHSLIDSEMMYDEGRPKWPTYLDKHSTLFPHLEHLEFRIPDIRYTKSRNPKDPLWATLKTNLGPDRLPYLKTITLKCTWEVRVHKEPARDRKETVTKDLEQQVRRWLPVWDGDTRGVTVGYLFSMNYRRAYTVTSLS